jgi:hypothetical protein
VGRSTVSEVSKLMAEVQGRQLALERSIFISDIRINAVKSLTNVDSTSLAQNAFQLAEDLTRQENELLKECRTQDY